MIELSRATALNQALKNQGSSPFTVVRLRDEMLKLNNPHEVKDKAQLRRWVYGKLETLSRQGSLHTYRSDLDGKTYFEVVSSAVRQAKNEEINLTEDVSSESRSTLDRTHHQTLTSRLQAAQMTSLVREEELKTYQGMSKEIPELSSTIASLLEDATHEHTRALGQIAALEKLVRALGS